MKLILVTFLLAVSCGCQAATLPEIKLDAGTRDTLTRLASLALIRGYQQVQSTNVRNNDVDTDTRVTLTPPFPDLISLPDLALNFTDVDVGAILTGTVEYQTVTLEGLESLDIEIDVSGTPIPDVSIALKLGTLVLKGVHDTNISVLAEELNLIGAGEFELKLVDPLLNLNVKVSVSSEIIQIDQFSVGLEFTDLTLNFANTELNGTLVDWDVVNEGLNCLFKVYWPILKGELEKSVKDNVNKVLKGCQLSDLIDLDFTCLLNPPAGTQLTGLEDCTSTQLVNGDLSCVRFNEISSNVLPSLFEAIEEMNAGIEDYDCAAYTLPPTTTPTTTTPAAASNLARATGLLLVLPVMYMFA